MSLEVGDLFSAKVNLTRTGTGSVKVNNTTVSVGPLTCEEGTHIQLKYLGQREVDGMQLNYAICLTEDAINNEYEDYLDQILDLLLSDGLPSTGEVTYARVERYEGDIAYASLGEYEICLGPINADIDDLVQIEGYSDTYAKVLTESVKPKHYDQQFKILTKQTHELPIEIGEEYSSAVSEFVDGTPVVYVKNIPVKLPDCEANLGQKVDIELEGFDGLYAVGEILELHDEVSRIDNPGHWARMQWLRESGYGTDPLPKFTSDFIGVPAERLPEDDDLLKSALIGEAFRLALADKAEESTEDFPRAHISGIRHWVVHKLATILGDPDEEEDEQWFINTLKEGQGPTLTFLGDVLELSNGYYAAGPTRAVLTRDDEAVLVSGQPTQSFRNRGFEVEIRGLSRVLKNTTQKEIEETGITLQTVGSYTGTDAQPEYDLSYLQEFISARDLQEWEGDETWTAYSGSTGYGFDWDDTPVEVQLPDSRIVSLWQRPIEFSANEYYLQVTDDAEETAKMVPVPIQYYKQICLIIDSEIGVSRRVEFTKARDGIHLKCDFSPTKSQMRWLTAIGARWRGYRQGNLHWLLDPSAVESVVETFESLPVTIVDKTD